MKEWVVIDGPNGDMHWVETKEKAEDCIKSLIWADSEQAAMDGGYPSECDKYYLLHLVGRAQLQVVKRREDQIIDDEGCDQDGEPWEDNWKTMNDLVYVTIEELKKNEG